MEQSKTRKEIEAEQAADPAWIAYYEGDGPHPSIEYTVEYYEGLKSLLIECNNEYHTEGTPRYSDDDYDALMRLLKRIEFKHPERVKPDSPSQTVGAKPEPASDNKCL